MISLFDISKQNEHSKYIKSLQLNHSVAIKTYINSSTKVNSLLLDNLNPSNPQHIKEYGKDIIPLINNLDYAILNAPSFKETFTVYRGIAGSSFGDLIRTTRFLAHPNYMSTSIDRSVAFNNFASNSCCVFEILVEPSSNVKYLFVSGNGTSENEVLFQRNTYLIYKSERQDNDKTVFTVTVSSQKPVFQVRNIKLSTKETIDVTISEDDVEFEISMIDNYESDEELVESITDSFYITYKHLVPRDSIRKQVKQHVDTIKNNTMNGGGKSGYTTYKGRNYKIRKYILVKGKPVFIK